MSTSEMHPGEDASRTIDVPLYDGWYFRHSYVTVGGIEVRRLLSEWEASQLNREKGDPTWRYKAGDTYAGFDSEGDAYGAGRAIADSDAVPNSDGFYLVELVSGQWKPSVSRPGRPGTGAPSTTRP